MTRILLVEDDAALAELARSYLDRHGYAVSWLPRGDDAVEQILQTSPDLVLLDLMLPGLDGLEVCRRVREGGYRGAIVILTARGDDVDEILGLERGADDFLSKPMRPRVLLARIQALLRRMEGAQRRILLGQLSLDLLSRSVTLGEADIELTSGEFDLLAILARQAGEVVSRNDLSLSLWGRPWDGLDRAIDHRVSRLRRKLGEEGADIIKSIRGDGYLLRPVV